MKILETILFLRFCAKYEAKLYSAENFQQVPLQQVTIEAEVVRGENEDQETMVSFFQFLF